jgi:hypothetical protein
VQERDGHLQLCILDVLSSIGNGVWNPQDLGNHSSDTHGTTVKHPGNGIALQNVKEVPLSQLGTETTGYVPAARSYE